MVTPGPMPDAEALVALTRALVRLPTTNEPHRGRSEAPAAELVAATMRGWGWHPQVHEVAPGRPNVVAVVEGGGGPGPTLLFEGHTDVVTEGDPGDWSHDPWGAEVVDGRIHGRGAADMKAGLAAMLHATRALQLAGPFPGRVVVAALVDEEGLMAGVHAFVDAGLAAGIDGAVVCEPEGGEVCPVSKGALRVRVDLHGAMAHGAMPQHARNPVRALADLVVAVATYERGLQARYGTHPLLGDVLLTPTVALAGAAEQGNVVPAHAVLHLDVRTVPGVDHGEVVTRLRALADGAAAPHGVRAEVAVPVDRPPVDTPLDDPVVACLVAAHERVTGGPAVVGGVPGTTDGTVLTHRAGVPTVVYGPGGKTVPHQADEYVEIAEVVTCAAVYLETARRFLARGQA